jgi:hypothetical protein
VLHYVAETPTFDRKDLSVADSNSATAVIFSEHRFYVSGIRTALPVPSNCRDPALSGSVAIFIYQTGSELSVAGRGSGAFLHKPEKSGIV